MKGENQELDDSGDDINEGMKYYVPLFRDESYNMLACMP